MGQEQDLDQFRGEDDIPDDNDPAVPMARLDIDPGPGLGPRDGFVYEGWRDAIDIVVDEDCLHVRQASDDDMLNIREIREDDEEWSQVVENKETGERVFEDQLAVEKYASVLLCCVRVLRTSKIQCSCCLFCYKRLSSVGYEPERL